MIAQSPPNQIPFKPTISNMKKTEIVWEKITQNSKLPPEIIKKYSWISWIGLIAIMIVALELIYTDIKILL